MLPWNTIMTSSSEHEPFLLSDNIKVFVTNKFLIFGFMFGICFAEMFSFSKLSTCLYNHYRYTYDYIIDDYHVKEMEENIRPMKDIESHVHSKDNSTVADQLFKEIRIVCLVLTMPRNHKTKAIHGKRTWGKRCTKLIFISTVEDHELGSVALPVSEGRPNLWIKMVAAFKYVYKHHLDEFDWFLKADDDTYVILENLRYMLHEYNTDDPLYFGCGFKTFGREGYMSGGSGYVLSKEALKRFIEQAIPDAKKCHTGNDGSEDVGIGYCLQNVGVKFGDTRDELKRATFFPVRLRHHLSHPIFPNILAYWKSLKYNIGRGLQSCADYPISFHYITPKEMYELEYYIYHLRPYGIEYRSIDLPAKR